MTTLSKRLGGISSDVFVTPPDSKYECRKCRLILRQPVQAQCGHRFCMECFKNLVEIGAKPCDECKREKIYIEPISLLIRNKMFLDLAVEREIDILAAKCQNINCNWTGSIKNYQLEHEGRCKHNPVKCKACDIFVSRVTLERHKNHECQFRIVYCKYCKNGIFAKDIKSHDENCIKFPIECTDCGKKKIPRDKLAVHRKHCDKLKSEDLISTDQQLSIESKNIKHQQQLDKNKIDELTEEIRLLKFQLAKQSRDTDQSIRMLESYTYNGIFLWKISDFTRKQKDDTFKSLAVFSPAFFTDRYGYKVCLRIYLNGDGVGLNTHLSLFLVIMKGPYDELLKWPFDKKLITLMLLNPHNQEHFVDTFKPDIYSNSFQQPLSDMNIASGCPLFCPLNKLSDYMKNDVIFIKVMIE